MTKFYREKRIESKYTEIGFKTKNRKVCLFYQEKTNWSIGGNADISPKCFFYVILYLGFLDIGCAIGWKI